MKVESAARKPVEASATILVASDNSGDAALVRKLLEPEFDRVFLSTNPDLAVEDFESHAPDVLVLAFNTLEKSERHYLGLYRLSGKIHLQPHRTVILCNKDEVSRAYQACRKKYFDDYILFWPMTNDAPRLLMAVHHALGNLNAIGAVEQAELDIGAALDGFSRKLMQGKVPDVPEIKNTVGLEREIKRIKQEDVWQTFRMAAESVQPVKQWAGEFRKGREPHNASKSAPASNAMADCSQPTILVVDDDEFQRNVVRTLLMAENYRVVFATGGVEALNMLSTMQPDLILMDIMMPDLDGIETTRRLKAMTQFANVPVIMVTGNSEGDCVRDSMKAGAANFVVKPFDRDTLLAKVARALGPPRFPLSDQT